MSKPNSEKRKSMKSLVFDVSYSPLCYKLPHVRKVANHYDAILPRYNLLEIIDTQLERLPKPVCKKILARAPSFLTQK